MLKNKELEREKAKMDNMLEVFKHTEEKLKEPYNDNNINSINKITTLDDKS